MGKNNSAAKSAARQAAAEQAAQQAAAKENNTKVDVIQLSDLHKLAELSKSGNLDHNHIMDMIRVQHETFRMDPKAAEHTGISQDTIDKINRINAIEQVALLASVVTHDSTPFAISVRTAQLDAMMEVAGTLGVVIDQKALPAPNEKGEVALPTTAVVVSSEKKKAIKAEDSATAEKAELDPTKIENEDMLKKSLLTILVKGNGNENLYSKIVTAINFYESYLGIQAGKAEDPDAVREEIKKKTRADFLSDIAHLLGKCTFTIGGIAKFMYENTERTKNPVVAFCTLRDASINKKTGAPQIEDQMVADIVKVLIRWFADSEIQETNERIAGFENDIKLLKEKDEKKNAKAIEEGNKKIEHAKKHIEEVEQIVLYANMPDRSIVENFPTDYTDNKSEGFKHARMIASKILKTYYGDVDVKQVKMDSIVHNVQQYIGVIFNMFLPPLNSLTDYSEANITELEKAEASAEPEQKNE